uniref:Uncharacterized protein n=1 Tax=Setaria digitata TaxID=48799 RepID=A0A915PWU3_9BILA
MSKKCLFLKGDADTCRAKPTLTEFTKKEEEAGEEARLGKDLKLGPPYPNKIIDQNVLGQKIWDKNMLSDSAVIGLY